MPAETVIPVLLEAFLKTVIHYAVPSIGIFIVIMLVVGGVKLYRKPKEPVPGVLAIIKERQLQKNIGYSAERDDVHIQGELVQLGMAYAAHGVPVKAHDPEQVLWDGADFYPKGWSDSQWNPARIPDQMTMDDRIRHLTVAGALMAAEIDRITRQKTKALALKKKIS